MSHHYSHRGARTLVSKLKSLLAQKDSTTPIEIRTNISLIDIPNEPLLDWHMLGLDPAVNDDRLIAAIIKFKEQHPSEKAVLVSDDFLAQRKATSLGIEVLDPEGSIDILERPSEETATIRRLEKEIQELQRRIPEPRLSFWENRNITNTVRRFASVAVAGFMSEKDIAQQVAQKQEKLEQIITKAHGIVSSSEIDQFAKEYNGYVKKLEQALILKRTKGCGMQEQLQFILENTGSAPATDLELSLQFPKNSLVVGASDEFEIEFWGKIRLPDEPIPDWMRKKNPLDFASLTVPYFPPTTNPPEQPKPKGPLYDRADRSIVWFKTPKLRHKEDWILNPLAVFLAP